MFKNPSQNLSTIRVYNSWEIHVYCPGGTVHKLFKNFDNSLKKIRSNVPDESFKKSLKNQRS